MDKELKSIKLLFLQEIFIRQTDETHIYSADELCELLKEFGVTCERKSVYRDIDALREYGMDIVNVRKPKRGYYLNSRKFGVAEARLLIDAVQAAKFISPKKTKSLIYKIGSLLSEYQEEELREQVYVDSRIKCDKENLYEIIDVLDKTIKNKNQVRIVYARMMLENNSLKIGEGKVFIVNPYALLWSNDYYYLVCNNDKYSNLMHLRLDRILSVEALDTQAKHFSKVSKYVEKFDTADYSNKLFNMFTGEMGTIEMRCANGIIDDILEKFGENIPIMINDEEHFIFKADVELSNGLVSWIVQYGTDIQVLKPKELVGAVKERAQGIFSMYE